MSNPVLNAYGEQILVLPRGRSYSNFYPLIRRQIIKGKLQRELLHLYQEMVKERQRAIRPAATAARKKARAQLTNGPEYNYWRNKYAGRSSGTLRNLEKRFNALRTTLAKLEAGSNRYENWINYYESMMNRIYNSYSRIHPRFKTGSNIPHFAPSNWSLNNWVHKEKIPRELVRKMLLGGRLPRFPILTQQKRNYLNALRNTVTRVLKEGVRKQLNKIQRQRIEKAKETGRKLGSELSVLRYLPRPTMTPSNVAPNAVLRPSQMKLANRVARAPLKRNNFNSENAYINYLIKGPYASTANKARHKLNKFSSVKKYFNYLVAGAPNNWNKF